MNERQPQCTAADNRADMQPDRLGGLEIDDLRDKISQAELELAAAKKLVKQKAHEVEELYRQWRDAGLLGR